MKKEIVKYNVPLKESKEKTIVNVNNVNNNVLHVVCVGHNDIIQIC